MRIARPPSGFTIILSPAVNTLIAERSVNDPVFERFWADVLERLKFTAHLEGVPQERFGPGHRLWIASADSAAGRPRISLVYQVLGDRVRIRVANIA